MDTGKNELSKEIVEKIRKDVTKEPTEEEKKYDEKYTDIQTITNIFCAVMKFDEKAHDKYINYIFDEGKIWVFTDTDGLISKDFLFNIVLRMEKIDEPITLLCSLINEKGVFEAVKIIFYDDGNYEIFESRNIEKSIRNIVVGKIELCGRLWKRMKMLILEEKSEEK